jgi:hypothetical protein
LTRDWCAGYAAANPASEEEGLELLDSTGKRLLISWETVKWVCYVREALPAASTTGDASSPERLLRKRFAGRPRIEGLWLRLTLADGDELEGIAANDRSLLDGAGLMLTPPDTRSNTQRVFVPRRSIREVTVLGVVAPTRPKSRVESQPELFATDAANSDGNAAQSERD